MLKSLFTCAPNKTLRRKQGSKPSSRSNATSERVHKFCIIVLFKYMFFVLPDFTFTREDWKNTD